MTIYVLGALTILLPFSLIAWLAFSTGQSKFEWLLRFLLVGSTVFIFFRIGTWPVTSYYLRYLLAALLLGSALYSLHHIRIGYWYVPQYQWFRIGSTAFFALLAVSLSTATLSGTHYSGNTVNLQFPFAQGTYCVIQGGSNVMTNPFHSMGSNAKYALDMVEINHLGNRAASVFPAQLAQYHIFGEVVRSPCKGRVVKMASGLPDNMPPMVDQEHSAGNHIVIECDTIKVILAHLKEDSIKVSKGDDVKEGQPVGKVGNSGNSDEPHLHIQANSPEGRSVPIKFGGRFLATNDLYVAEFVPHVDAEISGREDR